MSRSCQSLNFNRAQVPPMIVEAGLPINLSRVEKANSSNIRHPLVICIPWKKVSEDDDIEYNVHSSFSEDVHVNQINNTIIVEPNEEADPDLIPSIQEIDSSFQKCQHYPSLIEQTNGEYIHMIAYIEQVLMEIDKLKEKKESLKIHNEVMKENISHNRKEEKYFSDKVVVMKQKLDGFNERNRKK